jgi:pimeloyl-ACP methyl ester carboxylesterase
MKKSLILTFLFLVITILAIKAQDVPTSKYSFGVRITGKGKPMILIPGLKGSADTYNDVVAHYKDHYKCYVITLAGFAGQPASGELDHPLRRQRDEIIQYIIDQHLKKPVLVGFSFGGSLALWIASTRPDLIGPLIELDGVPYEDGIERDHVNKDSIMKLDKRTHDMVINAKPQFWSHYDSVRHTYKFRRAGFYDVAKLVTDTNRVNQILDWDDKSDYKATYLMLAEAGDLDLRDSVTKVNSPILVLGSWLGWDNFKTKETVSKRYHMEWDPAKNVTITFSDHGKHFLMYDDLDWMLGQMDAFLKKN